MKMATTKTANKKASLANPKRQTKKVIEAPEVRRMDRWRRISTVVSVVPTTSNKTDHCYILKNLARKEGAQKDKPFSKRTFRKEINAIACRAGKHAGLDVFAFALKREQGKQARKQAKAVKSKRLRKLNQMIRTLSPMNQ